MSNYSKFYRCVLALWREENSVRMEETYRKYCVEFFNQYVFDAEMAWPGTGPDGPRSVSGGEHLRDHTAHDMNLTERDEIRFRQWFLKVTTYGFGNKPLNTDKKAA